MNRRNWFQSLTGLFVSGSVVKQPSSSPCITPAYAGFDGVLRIGGSHGGWYKFILRRGLVDNPFRYTGIRHNELAVWKNHDGSVSKLLYRNRDGKFFDLQFVPIDDEIKNPGSSSTSPTSVA